MAQFVNIYKCDLHKGPVVTSLHQVFLGDVEANRVGVHVTDNGEDVTLSGTCSGTAILCNGGTVALTGTVDGSLAYVDLPSAVYTVEGPVEIYVTLTQGDQTTTLLTAHGNAVRTDSGVVIDPGTIIPSVSALISDIDDAVASIPADYSDLLGTIAPDFSSSTAYTAGQYVWYSGTLYRFTSDHAAGSWTGTDAISAEIGEDVADLKGAVEQITEYIQSRNYFDPATAVISQAGTALTSGKIPATAGDTFYYSFTNNLANGLVPSSMYFVREFAADDTQLKQSTYYVEGYEVTEAQTAYIRVYLQQVPISSYYYMLEKNEQTLEYEAYFTPYYAADDRYARNLIDELQEQTETLDEGMQKVGLAESLVYPEKIYGVVGHQTNIYYENAIQYGTMDTIAKCDIGGTLTGTERYRDRLVWTPNTSGNTTETISMWKANTKNIALTKNVNFIAAPVDAGSGEIKVLVIGDSKVAYGQPTGYMKQLFANDSLTLTLLGSRYGNNNTGDETNRHEGHSAWSAYDYCNRATKNGVVNPFYNETVMDGSHFDFSMYMTNQGYTGVDYVIINLGTNDFGNTAYIYRLCISDMVDSIHRYNPNVKIILGLIEGVYRPKLEWATRNEAFMTYRKALIDFYTGKESENIWLNPMYLSMSLYDDFPKTTVSLSYADEFVQDGKTREYCSDGIHQNAAGFYKNAVSMYSIIKCIAGGVA